MKGESKYVVAAFYGFVSLTDVKKLQENLKSLLLENGIKGTILLAEEGINSTVVGSREAIDNLCLYLKKINIFEILNYKESYVDYIVFKKAKVKVKKEIITFRKEIDINNKGVYVNSEEWEKMLNDENTVVIDTRNDFEYKYGYFKNAINPEISKFTEFADWVENNQQKFQGKKIAMYCTGGIRCEKATSFMKKLGHNEVYHLEGGILKYLEDTKNKDRLWNGSCFIFDERTALDDNLSPIDT